ncbi:MAG: PIN domain-containing protein [Chloroflexota bacterium]
MSVFVDTSVFLAVLSEDDNNNVIASEMLASLAEHGEQLITTNYILVESYALIQRRMGMNAIRDFQDKILPALITVWISMEEHQRAMGQFLSENRRTLSFVDCSSVEKVFTFDSHFREQGFGIIP